MAFCTLGCGRRLQHSGGERKVAEAHADLAGDRLLASLVTRDGLDECLTEFGSRLTISMGGVLVAVGALLAAQSPLGG